MLEFSDRPKAVRVHRRDTYNNSREPVATINKVTLAVVADSGIELSNEEMAEIQSAIELMHQAPQLQRRLWTLQLPTILREAVEYCTESAVDSEMRILATAVAQAHSRLSQIQAKRRAAQLAT